MNRILSILVFISIFNTGFSQGIFDKQLPQHIYDETVIDSVYGIIMYENLVMALGGDSIRKNGVYPCNGWVSDSYKNGQVLHKGYYVSGQLQSYKNFYPTGQLERDFSSLDAMAGEAKIFYNNGKLKSHIKYMNGNPKQWVDYYESGTVSYEEKMNRSQDYYEYQKYYYPSGMIRKQTILTDKKELVFTYTEYNERGKIILQGTKIFKKDSNTYFDHGKWTYYDDNGKEIKVEKFDRGVKL